MKKKVLTFCFAFAFSSIIIYSYAGRQSMTLESGGNSATCYSTYSSPLLGGGKNIWRCGSCVRVKAKNFSDSGVCNF